MTELQVEDFSADMNRSRAAAMPRVTIALPVYNGGEFLRVAIESVLAQTFTDFELLISDNDSTDGTEAICREYASRDSRLIYKRNAANIGCAKNFNKLVAEARGTYFKWICHDDFIDPEFIRRCLDIAEKDLSTITVAPRTVVTDSNGAPLYTLGSSETDGLLASDDPVARHRNMIRMLQGKVVNRYLYGMHRLELLKKTKLLGSYVKADSVLASELALCGRLREVDDALNYFRLLDNPGKLSFSLQNYLDPSLRGRLKVSLSFRRSYLEFFLAACRSPLHPASKARALPSCFLPVVYRVTRGQAF